MSISFHTYVNHSDIKWKCKNVSFFGRKELKHLQDNCFAPFKPAILDVVLATALLWLIIFIAELEAKHHIVLEEKYSNLE